jgi:hypothetical protein
MQKFYAVITETTNVRVQYLGEFADRGKAFVHFHNTSEYCGQAAVFLNKQELEDLMGTCETALAAHG